jgi:hypothetical protein
MTAMRLTTRHPDTREGKSMPTAVELTDDKLVVHVQGADRFWALKSRLEIPLAHVAGAQPGSEEARKWLHGMRLGGTHIPGAISAGRFYTEGRSVFWDVHDPEKAIGIELRDERYGRLVLEVEDPERELTAIKEATAAVGGGSPGATP